MPRPWLWWRAWYHNDAWSWRRSGMSGIEKDFNKPNSNINLPEAGSDGRNTDALEPKVEVKLLPAIVMLLFVDYVASVHS